jgi:hypothetical protein
MSDTISTTRKPSVAATLKQARAKYDAKALRCLDYELSPARAVDGTALPMPMRFRIALSTATRDLRRAEDAYLKAYPTAKYVRVTKASA